MDALAPRRPIAVACTDPAIFVFNSVNKMKQVNHLEETRAAVNRHICSTI